MNETTAKLACFVLVASLAACHKGEWVLVYDDAESDASTPDVAVAGEDAAVEDVAVPDVPPEPEVVVPFDDAEITAAEFPSKLDCSAEVTAKITVKNIGTSSWTRDTGYRLGAVDD